MFTGIVQYVGKVVRVADGGKRIAVNVGPLARELRKGDSVCVSGVCLTVTAIDGTEAGFDASAETLARSTLGSLRPTSKVNLEPALRLGDRLGGHLVQGHVDGVATVRSVRTGREHVIEFAAPAELTDLMVSKGSAAIDGVSLTLTDVGAESFGVVLIPATLAATTLGGLNPAGKVNVETDVIGKYVRKYTQRLSRDEPRSGQVTLEKLKETGFA